MGVEIVMMNKDNPICTNAKMENMKKRFNNYVEKIKKFPGLAWKTIWKVGREDPRRVIHSIKVGLSLTLVSLLYLLEPLYEDIGQNALWAVMTVVVVLEFTPGMCFFFFLLSVYVFSISFRRMIID